MNCKRTTSTVTSVCLPLLLLVHGAASLHAQHPQGVPAQTGKAAVIRDRGLLSDPSSAKIRAAARTVMEQSTMKSAGRNWPDPAVSGVQACCRPGETKTGNVANLKLEYPKGTAKNKSKTDQSVYAVPACWTLTSFRRVQTKDLGPNSASEQVAPAGYVMSSSSAYQSEYQNVKNYVANLNIPDLIKADILVKIDEFVKNYSSYAASLQTSHASLLHKATIQGAGPFNGRTIYEAHYEVTETCCPPQVRDGASLSKMLKGWVDGVVAKLPKQSNP